LVKKYSGAPFMLLVGAAILSIVGSLYYYFAVYNSSKQLAHHTAPSKDVLNVSRETSESTRKEADAGELSLPTIITGKVIIDDITGHKIQVMITPILENGWVAIPRRFCLGGYSWRINLENEAIELPLEGGILADNEPVGIWRTKDSERITGAELSLWSRVKALQWIALADPLNAISISVKEYKEKGRIAEIIIPDSAKPPGVFIQEGKMVGWTFGEPENIGYLWRGPKGEELIEEIRIDDFYRTTFANSREERFAKALAIQNTLSAEQLEALTSAFRFESVLSSQNTPDYLKTENVIKRLHGLNALLLEQGYASSVADAYDTEILTAAADASVLVQVIQANLEAYGYEAAVDVFEAIPKEAVFIDPKQSTELQKLHLKLYHNWLANLMDDDRIGQGKQVYERALKEFPLDPRLQLFAVRLFLMEGDWGEAERLLNAREYPTSLLKDVEDLKAKIEDQKSEKQKIIIRFAPRSRNIYVEATIGGSLNQKFIVDTGASLVTVPSSTVNSLGIPANYGKSEKTVYTAGGVTQAPEVVLPSIRINDWSEDNITALVINLPGQPGWGLLGLNYLRRFQMDINYDDGILTLKPR
jgi:clan AA aspartic protease (TIGR02281 family)